MFDKRCHFVNLEYYCPMMPYTTIQTEVSAEIEEKKSRFIAQLAPVKTEEEALVFLERIRAEHRMARHNVYAYVLRDDGRVRYSDDGEPSKTAGLPTLETIQHAGLNDVIAVVTRYFGGTLLGTGGLVRAYTQATKSAIEAAKLVTVSPCVSIKLQIPYAYYDKVMHLVTQNGYKVEESSFTDTVEVHVVVLEEQVQNARINLQELIRNQGKISVSDSYDAVF